MISTDVWLLLNRNLSVVDQTITCIYLRMIKNIHMVISKNNPITMPKFKFFVDFCSVYENITTSFI